MQVRHRVDQVSLSSPHSSFTQLWPFCIDLRVQQMYAYSTSSEGFALQLTKNSSAILLIILCYYNLRSLRCSARIRDDMLRGRRGRGPSGCPIRPREIGPPLWMPCCVGHHRGVRTGWRGWPTMYTMWTRDSTHPPPTQKCTGYPVPVPGYPLPKRNNPKSNREEKI